MAAVRSLEEQIARKREELAPKQKFSFRRKPKKEGEPVRRRVKRIHGSRRDERVGFTDRDCSA